MTGIKRERPNVTKGITQKLQVACGKIYVTINNGEDGLPIEVFIAGSKSGGCTASQHTTARLTSALLRHGLVEEAIKQLDGIICSACQRWKGEMPKEERKNYPNSCGDAIARTLKYVVDKK